MCFGVEHPHRERRERNEQDERKHDPREDHRQFEFSGNGVKTPAEDFDE